MRSGVTRIIMDCVTVVGSWPAFTMLVLLCALFFGYLVPKAKAPIFANVGSGSPHKVLDEYFPSWSQPIAEQFLAAIGPDGRAAYRRFYLIMDFWFPGVVASLATASLLLIAFPPTSGWAWLCVLAVPAWLLDVLENITHFRMAGSYPNISSFAVRFGPMFTRAKWVFAIVPLTIALTGLGFHLLAGP